MSLAGNRNCKNINHFVLPDWSSLDGRHTPLTLSRPNL